MMTKDQIVDILYNDPALGSHQRDDIETFVSKLLELGNIVVAPEGFAIYVMVSDRMLELIRNNPKRLKEPDFVWYLLHMKGDNVHFIGIYGPMVGGRVAIILRGMQDVVAKRKPKSVSWFNQDMTHFHYGRTKCHPLS